MRNAVESSLGNIRARIWDENEKAILKQLNLRLKGKVCATQLILMGAPVRAQDLFAAQLYSNYYSGGRTCREMYKQSILAWLEAECSLRHRFTVLVLSRGVYARTSTSQRQSRRLMNHLPKLRGGGTIARVRIMIGAFAGVRVGIAAKRLRTARDALAALPVPNFPLEKADLEKGTWKNPWDEDEDEDSDY